MVVDNGFKKSAMGQQWILSHHLDKTLEIREASTDLPEGMPRAQMSPRPASDDRITVWVNGTFLDKQDREDLVAEAVVGSGDFDFFTYTTPESPLDYLHCCTCNDGQQMCWSCQSRLFNCCIGQSLCQLNCPPQACENGPAKQPQMSIAPGSP
jgi:hypothetical protein